MKKRSDFEWDDTKQNQNHWSWILAKRKENI